jgi:hypothetical protein
MGRRYSLQDLKEDRFARFKIEHRTLLERVRDCKDDVMRREYVREVKKLAKKWRIMLRREDLGG